MYAKLDLAGCFLGLRRHLPLGISSYLFTLPETKGKTLDQIEREQLNK